MKHGVAATLVVLLATATVTPGQSPEAITLPTPQPLSPPARAALPSLPALAHEVDGGMSQAAEYAGIPTPPTAPGPAADEPPDLWWFRGDYLFWWVRHAPAAVPLAVNESPAAGSPFVLGPQTGHFDPFSGGRFALGHWFDSGRTWGAEVAGFFLQAQTNVVAIPSDAGGSPGIDRPVTDGPAGEPLLVPVSLPGVLSGSVTTRATLHLSGVEANAVYGAFRGECWRLDLRAGYRHLDLHESLSVVQQSQTLIGPVIIDPFGPLGAGASFLASDEFATANHYNGGQVGVRAECAWGPCYLRLSGDVGGGATSQEARGTGATRLLPGTFPAFLAAGGVYADDGRRRRDQASFVSNVGAEAGFLMTSHVRLFATYSLLYWSAVVRPGDQIDAVVSPALVPPAPARPASPLHASDFWAQGVSLGLELSY